MNQINIDSLLSIGNSTKIEPQLKLDTTQLYQALLKIGSDGSGQLQVAAGSTPIKIALTTADLQQLVRPQNTASTQVTLSGQIQTANAEQVTTSLPQSTVNSYQGQRSEITARYTPTSTTATVQTSNLSKALDGTTWQVKLQPVSENQLSISMMKPAQQLPLTETAVFKLIQQASQLPQLQNKTRQLDNGQLQLQVQVVRQQERLLLSIDPARPLLALPMPQSSDKQQQAVLAQIPQFKDAPKANELQQLPPAVRQNGVLHLSVQQGQMQLSLQLTVPSSTSPDFKVPMPQSTGEKDVFVADVSKAAVNKNSALEIDTKVSARASNAGTQEKTAVLPAQTALSSQISASNQSKSQQTATINIVFNHEQLKALLPALTKQLVHQSLSLQHQQLQVAERDSRQPSTRALSAEQWQLKPNAQQWQVEVQAPTQELRVAVKDIDKQLQWHSQPIPTQPKLPVIPQSIDIPTLWRQLLPLTASHIDPLRITPELPPSVQAILHELKANTLDHQKVPAAAELQSQLNAALQFSPLQSQPNALTAAGSMAIALQLLIGRLSANTGEANRPAVGKEKLMQLVGQLNETQSGQLLKQLSGHSSQLQQAQFANIEQQAQAKTEHSQLFMQLPVLVQGQNQFVELAISEREADGKGGQGKKRAWQLTMKFQIPEQGHLLVQVHLMDAEVSMQFYAETEQTQQLTSQWLPLFKDRLKVQGLEIKDIQVQRGKIPEHLYQRGTSLLQVKV